MKIFKGITIVLVSLMAVACEKDYVEPNFKTEFFGIYGSMFKHGDGPANINPTYLETNKNSGMIDMSQGCLSHEWSFWKDTNRGEGEPNWELIDDEVTFLKKGSNMGYETITDFTPYIDSSVKPVNSLEQLNFVFEKGGKYKVTLRNTYRNPIEYLLQENDQVLDQSVNNIYFAQPVQNNKYEVDLSYEFEIYDTLKVDYKVFKDQACTNEISLKDGEITTVKINKGDHLYFKEFTGSDKYSMPTSRSWSCNQVKGLLSQTNSRAGASLNSKEATADFVFAQAGEYNVSLIVKRENEEIQHFPNSEKFVQLPLTIEVE